MEKHQIHFEKKFYLDKSKGYWISTTSPKIRAHVWVWKNLKGNIPKGWHIHHKDGDKSNNSIENLELLDKSKHLSLHMQDPKRKKMAKEMADKYRPLTKAWHSSQEGRAWHSLHGIKCWLKKKEIIIKCKCCHLESKTKAYHQEFCSNACKSKWRRDQGTDNIQKICERCSTPFISNKYAKNRFCGKDCKKNLKLNIKNEVIFLRNSGDTFQTIAEKLKITRKDASYLYSLNDD